jgi:D-alanyl-D-alanine dipeptidase
MRKWKLQYTVYPVVLTGVLYVSAVYAQNNLPVERSLSHYKKEIKEAPYLEMVELKSREPSIVYDFKYATRNNFMGRYMYPAGTRVTFLRKPAADSLIKIQRELNKEGLGLKVFDAYRPYSVTRHFWELVKDERYVANPAKGSHHNRGTAIDLTIIDLNTGDELNMGTGFDNFSDTAHHGFKQLTEPILQNREKLKNIMAKYGFAALSTEWWHYTYQSPIKFPVLDITFKKLANR